MSEEPKISSGGKTQRQEILDAQKEKRIPKCICCNHDLRHITVAKNDYIDWMWDESAGRYQKDECEDEVLDKPNHKCHEENCGCEYATWDFIDDDIDTSLGLVF